MSRRAPLRPARSVCLAALVAALAAPAAAQPPPANVQADRIGVADGLSSATVADLHQSRSGFLWAATGAGVDRYDGYAVRTYRHEPGRTTSLSHAEAHALADAPGGRLWVGTYGGGLNLLDPATDTARRIRHRAADPTSPSDDRVTAFHRDRRGRLWMATMAGLDRVDERTGRVRRWGATLGAPAAVRAVADAPGGRLWVGGERGLVRFDPGRGRVDGHVPLARLGPVMALASVADGGVWVGLAEGGLVRLTRDGRLVARFAADPADPAALCGARVQSLALDAQGALWVATEDGGLCRLDTARRRFTRYPADAASPHALASDRARSLLVDRGGLVWVGTWNAGMHKLRQTPFRHVRAGRESGFRSSDVMAFAEAPGGALWVGTYDAGLYRYRLDTDRAEQPVSWPAALRTGGVRALVYDRSGALWATVGTEVYRLASDGAAWRRVPIVAPPGAAVERAMDLAVGPEGTVWLATYGAGVCRAAPGAARLACLHWPAGRDLTSRTVYAVHPDPDGTLWVAAWGSGVDRVDPRRGRVAHYDESPDRRTGLSSNSVTSFFRDARGRLWLTTYGGGVDRFDPSLGPDGGFHHVTPADGLPDPVTYGVLQAGDGALWISTNRGLARMDKGGREIETFGVEDGLQSNEFNGGAFLALADGRLVFGGIGGFNVFHPKSLHAKAPAPPVAVTALRVLGAPADVPRDLLTRGLTLGHDENAVSFDVAALDFTAPARNRLAYWLDGLDAEWTKAGTLRTAAYTNLAPGRYTLRVRASNADGVWTEPGLAIPLTVRPAWWQTWAFRLAGLGGVLGALVAGVRFAAQRRLRAQVGRLEAARRLQHERERISRDLHDHVGAQLSSVLAGVEIARLARLRPGAAGAGDPLDAVEADARETMRQLRETIWALHDEHVTVGDFAARVEADLRARVRGRARPAVAVVVEADRARVLGPAAALHLYRIVREAATNSLKHAGADTLTVTLSDADGHLTVEVADDGRFVPPGVGVGGDGAAAGDGPSDGALGASGFGIRSMQARADALGARFSLATECGTTVRLRVPLARLAAGAEADGA